MKLRSATIATLDNDDNGICLSQTPAATGVQNLTIAGALATAGVATIAAAQKVTITSTGDDSGRTFTITGTDADGTVQSEAVTGANAGAATSTLYFKTVTAITTDDDTADAVIVGPLSTNGAVSPTIESNVNEYGDDYKYLAAANITGAGTIAVQTCPEAKSDTFASNGVQANGSWIADTTFTGKTADFQSLLLLPARSVRLIFTAHTSGGATLRLLERSPKVSV